MSVRDDGGPAFPNAGESGVLCPTPGMSLRDWFAGQVMSGFTSEMDDAALVFRPGDTAETARARYWAYLSTAAYEVADAMLAERAK